MKHVTPRISWCLSLLIVMGLLMTGSAYAKKDKVKDKGKDESSEVEGQKRVPPGLEKKGGIPPGQLKKQQRQSGDADVVEPSKETKTKKAEAEEATPSGRERRGPFGLFGKRRSPEEQARIEKEAKEKAK